MEKGAILNAGIIKVFIKNNNVKCGEVIENIQNCIQAVSFTNGN